MTPITHSIVIARPREEVFAFVTDFRNDTKWWKPVIRTEKVTPDEIGVGSIFKQYSKVLFVTVESELRVTEWNPPEFVTYINESPQLAFSLRYQFDEDAGGTRFSLIAELEMKRLLRLLKPITMRTLHKQLQEYFELLKQVMECHLPPETT